jgi:hypothetical protein
MIGDMAIRNVSEVRSWHFSNIPPIRAESLCDFLTPLPSNAPAVGMRYLGHRLAG